MWTTWHSPGWLLVWSVLIAWRTLQWRLDAGLEPVEMLGNPVEDQDRVYARFRLARAVNRIAWLLVIGAVVHVRTS